MTIIATAAWSIPKKLADRFSQYGSSLSRYASVFDGVEINSTFYRRHKTSTFARWAESVPDEFRFAVKMPKEITHTRAMKDIAQPFDVFLEDIAPLAEKRGPLLCQLRPSLAFDAELLEAAFKAMRDASSVSIAVEVRHKSWASVEALDLLTSYAIDQVLADSAPVWAVDDFADPPRYVRLHGKPKIYYSSYTNDERPNERVSIYQLHCRRAERIAAGDAAIRIASDVCTEVGKRRSQRPGLLGQSQCLFTVFAGQVIFHADVL